MGSLFKSIIASIIVFFIGTFIQGFVPWFPWVPNVNPRIINYVVQPSWCEDEKIIIRAGQKVFVDVEAKDWNKDCLEYIWNISPGQVATPGRTRDRRVTYIAPNEACKVSLHIIVYDGRSGMAEVQDTIIVK